MWDNIRVTGSNNESFPLNELGIPQYKSYLDIPGTYTYPSKYKPTGDKMANNMAIDNLESKESITSTELFDSRNKWIDEGILSRIFPTWSTRKFYKLFSQTLYKVLLKHYRDKQINSSSTPEDYWFDVQLYFLQKTQKEQIAYDDLVDKVESYCHYPLKKSYKNGAEIIKGILWLYNEKIKNTFKNEQLLETENVPLNEELTEDLIKTEDLSNKQFEDSFVFLLKEHLSKSNLVPEKAFLYLLSLERRTKSNLKKLEKEYELNAKQIKKFDYVLHTKVYPQFIQELTVHFPSRDINKTLLHRWAQVIVNERITS